VHFAGQFVQKGEGIRMGLVLFAGEAFAALPLTQDRDALLTYLMGVDADLISRPGTDLGRALRVAANVFDPASTRPRAILLLSDGEHAGGALDGPLQDLRSRRVRVSGVGFGTPAGAIVPGPGPDPLRDVDGQPIRSRRVDAILTRVSVETGGRFRIETEGAPDPDDLLPPQPSKAEEAESPDARFPLWVLLAALALAAEILLSSTAKRPSAATIQRLATTALAVGLLAAGMESWLREGDTQLRKGNAREALSLYRRVERTTGPSPSTQVRVGNALYRLGRRNAASAAFFEALREPEATDEETRFVATFNLGTTLLAQEHYREARDALWTALRVRPDRLDAKFNYEWAVERIEPDEDVARGGTGRDRETERSTDAEDSLEASSGGASVSEERERHPAQLTEEEAERWLRSIEEDPIEPLRQQMAGQIQPGGGRPPGGQSW
jgi:tetratricopeptide (TPR) repeat protein